MWAKRDDELRMLHRGLALFVVVQTLLCTRQVLNKRLASVACFPSGPWKSGRNFQAHSYMSGL